MFEYHCWAVVNGGETETELLWPLEEQIEKLSHGSRGSFHVTHLNESIVTASGVRNHYQAEVLNVFWWLARECPRCYGLLYFRGPEPGEDGSYRFRVQRIRNGDVEDLEDRYFDD